MTTDSVPAHNDLIASAREHVAPYRRDLDAGKWVTGILLILDVEKLADALEQQSSLLATARADGAREARLADAQYIEDRPGMTKDARYFRAWFVGWLRQRTVVPLTTEEKP